MYYYLKFSTLLLLIVITVMCCIINCTLLVSSVSKGHPSFLKKVKTS